MAAFSEVWTGFLGLSPPSLRNGKYAAALHAHMMTTVLHLHIPRTGGISVSRALAAALSEREIVRGNTSADLQKAVDRGADIGLVTGHFRFGLHELLKDFVYFVVLRDPVERVRSIYDFVRMHPIHPQYERYRANSLAELLADPRISRSQLSNGQVMQVAGSERGADAVGGPQLERAWKNLCRDDVVVATTERIDDGLRELSRRIGRPLPPYRKAMNKVARSAVSADVIERIRELNRLDAELYRRARERLQG